MDLGTFRCACLVVLAIAAAFFDLRERRIPDLLTFSAMGIGFGIAGGECIYDESLTPAIPALTGLAVAFICFLPPVNLGWLGAGDLKLFLGIGALVGAPLAWTFSLQAVYNTACVGAVMAALMLIWRGELLSGLKRSLRLFKQPKIEESSEGITLPYGFAMATGTLIALMNAG